MTVKLLFTYLVISGCFGFTLFVNEAVGAGLRRDRPQGLWWQAPVAFALLALLGLGAGAGLLGSAALLLD